MYFIYWSILFLSFKTVKSGLFLDVYQTEYNTWDGRDDPGEPLFLTPYIEKDAIEEAQQLSKVTLNGSSIDSYSGFLTVNKNYNSNMFFWYFPSYTQDPRDPIIIWLQGGPGASSLIGLFTENGPFGIDQMGKLYSRKYTWATKYNMLFIDNPVGTGFSFTENDKGYATNEVDVAENLYNMLLQFFELFPDLKGNHVYITGESYAGKYVPAFAYRIHKEAKPKKVYMRGVAIGNGFTDPPEMIKAYSNYLFQIGLFDENQRDYFKNQTDIAVNLIQQKQWLAAFKLFDILLNGDLVAYPSFFKNCTGSDNYFNYLLSTQPADFDYYVKYVTSNAIRRAIHVGKLDYHDGKIVEMHMINDVMQSAKSYLETIANHYKVLVYNGQLDIIVALPLTEAMIETLQWSGAKEYKRTKRHIWKVNPNDTEVAGYVKRVHDFYQVSIRNAGHMAPHDQPERTWDMIDRFISDRPF